MGDNKHTEKNDPERTLITLDQLSQTIEVMTSVVNRLRQHLSEQIKNQMLSDKDQEAAENLIKETEQISGHAAELSNKELPKVKDAVQDEMKKAARQEASDLVNQAIELEEKDDSFVVEVSQKDGRITKKRDKILH